MATWDESDGEPASNARVYKVLKANPFRELVNQVAADLRETPDRVRLWSMVNRQNKTVRPDQPIIDLEMSEYLPRTFPVSQTMLSKDSYRGNLHKIWKQGRLLPTLGRGCAYS